MKHAARKPKATYEAMTAAIEFARARAAERPTVEQMAEAAGMSASRFAHVFAEWTGITPKRYVAHLTKERAKDALHGSRNVLAATIRAGLSSPSRLHDLLVTHEALTPGEYASGDFEVSYGVHPSPFGPCLIGVTPRGICHLAFVESMDGRAAESMMRVAWPKAQLKRDQPATAEYVRRIFVPRGSKRPLHLLLRGTNFQIKVWEALLAIPQGRISSYGEVAKAVGTPGAVRAVGTACGANKIAYIIPCHRVLTSAGGIGGYRWGLERKRAMLAKEADVVAFTKS